MPENWKPETLITLAATTFAAIAALAATVQAYVSWTGRSDIARANLATLLASHCNEGLRTANHMAASSQVAGQNDLEFLRNTFADYRTLRVHVRMLTGGLVRVGQLRRGVWDDYNKVADELEKSINQALADIERKIPADTRSVRSNSDKIAPAIVALCEASQFVPE